MMRVLARVDGYRPGSKLPIVHRYTLKENSSGDLQFVRSTRIRVFRKSIESHGFVEHSLFTCDITVDPARNFLHSDPSSYQKVEAEALREDFDRGRLPSTFLFGNETSIGEEDSDLGGVEEEKEEEEVCVYAKKYSKVPKEFKIGLSDWVFLCRCVERRESLLLCGPTGCGKTKLAHLLADAVGVKSEYFAFGGMSDPRGTLIGRTRIGTEGDWFQIARFAAVLTEVGNRVMIWDEVNRSPSEAHDILLPVLQEGILDIPEGDTVVVRKRLDTTAVIATANIGAEYGVEQMGPQFLDRFTRVDISYIQEVDSETDFVMEQVSGLKRDEVRVLVRIAHDTRGMWERDELPKAVSTRRVLAAAQLLADGFTVQEAVQRYFLMDFDGAGGPASEKARVLQVAERHAVFQR